MSTGPGWRQRGREKEEQKPPDPGNTGTPHDGGGEGRQSRGRPVPMDDVGAKRTNEDGGVGDVRMKWRRKMTNKDGGVGDVRMKWRRKMTNKDGGVGDVRMKWRRKMTNKDGGVRRRQDEDA